MSHHRYLLVLGVLFTLVFAALAIAPSHRADWALENALVVAFVVAVALTYKRLTLSRVSYTLIWRPRKRSAASWARRTSAPRATSGTRTRTWRSPASAR